MPDMLVKLFELPDAGASVRALTKIGVAVRRALACEKHQVAAWVRENFGEGWAGECDVAFCRDPPSCFIAIEGGRILGFACHDSACRNFFGPLGVLETARNRGIGTALLLSALHAMAANGYAYAVIGGAGSAQFYAEAVGAVEIPGSSPGIYRDRLTGGQI